MSTAAVLAVHSVGVRGDGPPPPGGAYHQSPNYAYQYAVKDDYFGVDFSAGILLIHFLFLGQCLITFFNNFLQHVLLDI